MRRTLENYREFFGELYRDYLRTDKGTRDILLLFLGGGMELGFEGRQDIPERALDPAFTTAAETCSHWRIRTDLPMKLSHDKAGDLIKDKWLWHLMMSPNIEQKTVGIPGRKTIYPLNVVQTIFEDSRSHLQLQFCDLLAGATAEWCRQFLGLSHDNDYVQQLGNAGIEELRIGEIWPQCAVTPEQPGMKGWSGEGVDFLTGQLERLTGQARRKSGFGGRASDSESHRLITHVRGVVKVV